MRKRNLVIVILVCSHITMWVVGSWLGQQAGAGATHLSNVTALITLGEHFTEEGRPLIADEMKPATVTRGMIYRALKTGAPGPNATVKLQELEARLIAMTTE